MPPPDPRRTDSSRPAVGVEGSITPPDAKTINDSPSDVVEGSVEGLPASVGDFRVIAKLGSGGMGTVYLVRNFFFDRDEALKVIGREHNVALLRERFLTEMRSQAALDHENVVKIHYAGESGGQLYFAMEFIADTLKARIDSLKRAGRRMDPQEAATVLKEVAKAVVLAHEKGIYHCDIKPSNILLTRRGAPKLADFGLAQLRAAGPGKSRHPIGTPRYMPPEQATDGSKGVDARSDVYGLGAVLYEMLTGRAPYADVTDESVLDRVRNPAAAPARPRDLNPAAPAELEAVCLKCLAKVPARRYQSAAELVGALRQYLRPPWWRRHAQELLAGGVAVVAWLMLHAVGFNLWSDHRAAADMSERAQSYFDDANWSEAKRHYLNARDHYRRLGGQWVCLDRSGTRTALGRVHTRLGRTLVRLREYPDAHRELEAAESLLRPAGSGRSPAYNPDLADVYHVRGTCFQDQAQWQDAGREFQNGLDHRRRPGLVIATYREADETYWRDLALSHGYLGDAQLNAGQLQPARMNYEEASAIRGRIAEANPRSPEARCMHARDFGNLAQWHEWQGKYEEAQDENLKRLDYLCSADSPVGAELPAEHVAERAEYLVQAAWMAIDRGRELDRVIGWLTQSEAEFECLKRTKDDSATVRSGRAAVNLTWGRYYFRTGDFPKARARLTAAHELLDGLDAAKLANVADYLNWSAAFALLGEIEASEFDRHAARHMALFWLKRAADKNFANPGRIKRDTALQKLRQSKPDDFAVVERQIDHRGSAAESLKVAQ